MTKLDLVKAVVHDLGTDEKQTMRIIESAMKQIKIANTNGRNVYLRGFGTFGVVTRKVKIARNISKGERLTIPAHKAPAFKPSKEFKKSVARGYEN